MRTSRRPRCSSAVLAAVLVLASGAGSALAGHARSVATYRNVVESGAAAFAAGRFDDARAAFEAAFAIHPDPVLVFNIASCWRRAGNAAQALAEYHRFLSIAPASDPRRSLATRTIESLEQAAEAEPSPQVEPAEEADLVEVIDDDPAPAEDPAPAPRPHRSRLRPVGLGVAGLGAAGAIASIAELIYARTLDGVTPAPAPAPAPVPAPEDQESPPPKKKNGGTAPPPTEPAPTTPTDTSARDRANRRALLFGVSGAALLAAGATVYYLGKRSEHRALQLTISGSTEGATLLLGGRF